MIKAGWFITCFLLILLMSLQVVAQIISVDELYSKIENLVAEGKHPSLALFKLKAELKALQLTGRDTLKGGILLHYAQCRQEAINSLEKFRSDYPGEDTPEIIAILARDYALTSQLHKAEEMNLIWKEKYSDNKALFRFSRYERMVDGIEHSLLVCYARVGTPEQVFSKIDEMIKVRDRDKPENFPNSTLINLGSELRAVLGRYDEALDFIEQELKKFEKGSNFYQMLLMARLKVEYSKIASESGFGKALEHLIAGGDQIQDKYILRRYNTELASAKKAGTPMFPLNVTDWLKYEPTVENLKGKVILLDLFTST